MTNGIATTAMTAHSRRHNNVQPAQRDAGNRNARRIPDEISAIASDATHAFRVSRRDDRRFNYGGYWFVYNEPWPAEWSYDDDVYVDDIDGDYYLIDRYTREFAFSLSSEINSLRQGAGRLRPPFSQRAARQLWITKRSPLNYAAVRVATLL